MKKLTLFAIALLASAVSFAALNPFAYGLSSKLSADETTLTVNYSLNATATAVSVVILDGETVVKTVDCADKGLTKGAYTVEIPTTDFPKTKSLTWKVEVKGESVATPTIQDTKFSFYLPYGLDCDVDPESDYLGNWYVIEAAKHNATGYMSDNVQRGLYAFDATLTGIKNKNGTYGFTGGVYVGASKYNNSTSSSSPTYVNLYRVVTSGGRVFIGRFEPDQAPIVEANPGDLDANFTEVIAAGKRVASIDAYGRGENLRLVMLDTDLNIHEYDLGTAKSISGVSRTIDKDGLEFYRNDGTIIYDNEGEFWLNQHRSTATKTCPTIAHLSTENGFDYNNVDDEISHDKCSNSGIAINPAGTELAVVGAGTKKLTIYTISKDNTGKISLTKKHTISTAGDNHTALSYDYAGNLYVANRSAETITFYAMPYSGTVVTPCASKYAFQLQEEVVGTFYTVTANVNDPAMGEITGNDGQYTAGATATLTAEPAIGYQFVNWTVGEETKTENPLTLTVNSNLTVTANFVALAQYTITATANDAAMDAVEGAGKYTEGETVTLKAIANTGHEFVDWNNGATEATLTFVATKDSAVIANFKKLSYTVTAVVNDDAKGSVSGIGTYEYGATATVEAVAADGYELLYWSDRSTENPRTVTVDGNKVLNAYFVKEYDKEPTFKVEKLWENTNVPTSTNNGYQAAGWDQKIYMKDRVGQEILVFSDATTSATYATTDKADDQSIAADDAGNLILRSGTSAFYNTPKQVIIYKKGETNYTTIDFTLPAGGRCDFISASGDVFSEEGGYVYFYCQNKTTVNRVKIANGEYVSVDQIGNNLTTGQTQAQVTKNIFGNLITHARTAQPQEVDVITGMVNNITLPNFKISTCGMATFELGGKEWIAYNVAGKDFNSEWNLYNMTDKKLLSETAFYAKNTTDINTAANWLNVQVVDEKTAYIYQFCPKVAVAVWKVTCDTGEEPGTGTAVDNTTVAPQVQKIVRDGQVLIIRDGKTFNMMGQEVR